MQDLITFGAGPLFRLSFTLLLLMLGRLILRSLVFGFKGRTLQDTHRFQRPTAREDLAFWTAKLRRLWRQRFLRSLLTTVFHVGMLVVPLFTAAHVIEWRRSVGFSWWVMSDKLSDILTLTVLALIPLVLIFRGANRALYNDRMRIRDWWLFLLAIPFATGYLCSAAHLTPKFYHACMFLHVYSGCAVIVMVAVTDVARCLIFPIARLFNHLGAIPARLLNVQHPALQREKIER